MADSTRHQETGRRQAAGLGRRYRGWSLAVGVVAITALAVQANAASAKPVANSPTGCSENSFFDGAVSPSNSGVVSVPLNSTQAFSVVYHDEKPINMNPGFEPTYTVTDSGGNLVAWGTPDVAGTTAPAGTKDKNNSLVSTTFTPTAPGTYTVTIKAWDGDQNKTGGDCGEAVWALNTPAPPTTTTAPPRTTTTKPVVTTSTTVPTVLGRQFVQSPVAPAVSGTPALTG